MSELIPNPDEIDAVDQSVREKILAITAEQKAAPLRSEPVEPVPAEPETPTSAETSPLVADESAKDQKELGNIFLMPSDRPRPPSKVKEEGNVIVAKALAEQLGTSPELKALMRIDERKMAVLDDATLAALSHFSYRFVYDGIRYWGHITEWWLTGSQGLGGLGRRHILQALANTSGVQSVDRAKKPNLIARNLWAKDWQKKAEMRGEVVED